MNKYDIPPVISDNHAAAIDLASCTIKQLNAYSVLCYFEDASTLLSQLFYDEQNKNLAIAISTHASLAFHCLYQNDSAVFNTPLEAAKQLTINQLCDVYAEYINQTQDADEYGKNECFNDTIKSIKKEQ